MSESSLSISPVVEPFAGGLIGFGLGYSMAPRKYQLRNLLLMAPEQMTQIYTPDVIRQMSPNEKKALDAIFSAKDEYHASNMLNRDEVRRTAVIWQNRFQNIDIPQTLRNNFQETRASLVDAIKKENYTVLYKRYRAARKAAQDAPNNQLLQDVLLGASEALSAAKIRLAGKMENYKNTVRNIRNERLYAIRSNPTEWINAKDAYKEFLAAVAKQRTLVSNKLFELSNNKNLLKCYNVIKEYLPKARTKSALTSGFIVGGLTSLVVAKYSQNATRA